jgi:hypothetical protein
MNKHTCIITSIFIYGQLLAVSMAMALGLLVFKRRDKIEA